MLLVKLHFFKHVASILKEFVMCFQTDRPMLPFLAASLDQTLRRIMKKFVSTKDFEEASAPYKLIKVDFFLHLFHCGKGARKMSSQICGEKC